MLAPVLFTIFLHVVGAWIFAWLTNNAPRPVSIHPIEVSIVSPPEMVTPPPPPTIPKRAARAKQSLNLAPTRAPVAAQQQPPAVEHATATREVKMAPAAPVSTPQPALSASSRDKSAGSVASRGAASASRALPATPAVKAAATSGTEEITAPSFQAAYLSNPKPPYPPAARRLKLQGTATVRVMVSPEGRPKSVRLENSSGAHILDEAALAAVQQWTFVPARRGNKGVAAEVDVPVRFSLN